MRVLVTGGAGFIGSRVVPALVEKGHEVRVLDALLPSAHTGDPPRCPDGVEFVRGDVRDPDTVQHALRGVEAVCHQAAMVGRGREILDAPQYTGCNDFGTATLLAAMTEAGIGRLVHGSSVVIYGEGRYRCSLHGTERPARRRVADLEAGRFEVRCSLCGRELMAEAIDEDDIPAPAHNVYAVTKLAQEHLVASWAAETGGCASVLRYHSVYGGDMPSGSPYTGVIAVFRSAVLAGQACQVFEDGKPRRDFVHVADVATANVAALSRSEPGFRAYNVCSGTARSIFEIASQLAAAGGAPPPVITGDYRVADVRHIFGSPARLQRELGWRPRTDFATVMRELVAARVRASG